MGNHDQKKKMACHTHSDDNGSRVRNGEAGGEIAAGVAVALAELVVENTNSMNAASELSAASEPKWQQQVSQEMLT